VDETPLGLFAEIEGDDGAVRALEVSSACRKAFIASRIALYLRARSAGRLPKDMVFT
jgi:hypothetical protein